MIRRKQNKGFTLIEVTLAIVIGIIMIAGATLIYNQAKTSAGNSRAQAKVVALQQLVEEFAAQNQGLYPSQISDVNALWKRKRPDDWNKSPWGGLLGSGFSPTDQNNGIGVGTGSGAANAKMTLTASGSLATKPTSGVLANTDSNQTLVGGLGYDYATDNASWSYATDIMTNRAVDVKGYSVYIANQQGQFPNFVTGGKTNQ